MQYKTKKIHKKYWRGEIATELYNDLRFFGKMLVPAIIFLMIVTALYWSGKADYQMYLEGAL